MRATCIDLAVEYKLADRRDVLKAAVRDPAPMVREKGWKLWQGWQHTVPLDTVQVFQAMSDKYVLVRLAVISCLSNSRFERSSFAEQANFQAAVRALTRDPSFYVRQDVIHLILMSRLLEAMQTEVLGLARDPHSGVRGQAVSALRHLPRSPEVQAVLERALNDESEYVRETADHILNGCR